VFGLQRTSAWVPRICFATSLSAARFPADCERGLATVLSPDSALAKGLILCLLGPNKQTTLSGLRLIESVTPFVSKSSRLLTEAEARAALVDTFGLVVDESEGGAAGSRVIFHDSRGFFAPAFAASTYGTQADEEVAKGGKGGKGKGKGGVSTGKTVVLGLGAGAVAGLLSFLLLRKKGAGKP
jgi:hypothetical protein